MSTGRNTPRGQRRSAWKMGMALWTPMARASYEHAETTPRPPRSPPTITGRPRSSGRRACSTEAKKASMSRCRIARCDTNICSYLTPRGTDGQSSREGGAAQGRLHVQRRQTASALHGKVEPWDVAPQRLEAIEVARRRREDVHDHIDEVEQDPLGFALALNARRTPSRAELALDLLGDGFGLAGVGAGGDHEEIGPADGVAHREDDDVLGLLVGGVPGDVARQFFGRRELCVECYGWSFGSVCLSLASAPGGSRRVWPAAPRRPRRRPRARCRCARRPC